MQYLFIGLILLAIAITVAIEIAKWALIAAAAVAAFLGVLLLLYGVYAGLRRIYHVFNPAARQRFLERQAREKIELEKYQRQKAAKKAKEKRKKQQAERILRLHREAAEQASRAEAENRELMRQRHRDADYQDQPYTYEIGQHANEALAIRYGIANQERTVEEYYYFAKGGVRTRNSSRDKVYWISSKSIVLRKLKSLGSDQFIAALTNHGDRKVRVVIERGTEYVKTFLPLDDVWFETHRKLEETLKHNKTFSLKELASFHVQKVVQ